jgi:hypothetical protein
VRARQRRVLGESAPLGIGLAAVPSVLPFSRSSP